MLMPLIAAAVIVSERPIVEPARIPLEVVAIGGQTVAVSGNAAQPDFAIRLRNADAIVVTDGPRQGQVLPVARIGETIETSAIAWCEHDRGGKLIVGNRYLCWQDRDGDGRIDHERVAVASTYAQPLTIALVGPAKIVPPFAYRIATAAERHSYTLTYQYCNGTDGMPRYERKLRDAPGPAFSQGCAIKARRVSATATLPEYQLDILAYTPTASGTRLTDTPKAGLLLDRIDAAGSVMALGQRPTLMAEAAAAKAARPEPFRYALSPEIASNGTTGEIFLNGTLSYKFRGVVTQNAAMMIGWTRRPRVTAGSFAYGVPVTGGATGETVLTVQQPKLMWCVPQLTGDRLRATCLIPTPKGYTIADNGWPAYLVTAIGGVDALATAGAEIPVTIVDEQAPHVTITQRLVGWSAKAVRLVSEIATREGKTERIESQFPRAQDGSASVRIGGGVVRLSQTANGGFRAEVTAPFRDDGSAVLAAAD